MFRSYCVVGKFQFKSCYSSDSSRQCADLSGDICNSLPEVPLPVLLNDESLDGNVFQTITKVNSGQVVVANSGHRVGSALPKFCVVCAPVSPADNSSDIPSVSVEAAAVDKPT